MLMSASWLPFYLQLLLESEGPWGDAQSLPETMTGGPQTHPLQKWHRAEVAAAGLASERPGLGSWHHNVTSRQPWRDLRQGVPVSEPQVHSSVTYGRKHPIQGDFCKCLVYIK